MGRFLASLLSAALILQSMPTAAWAAKIVRIVPPASNAGAFNPAALQFNPAAPQAGGVQLPSLQLPVAGADTTAPAAAPQLQGGHLLPVLSEPAVGITAPGPFASAAQGSDAAAPPGYEKTPGGVLVPKAARSGIDSAPTSEDASSPEAKNPGARDTVKRLSTQSGGTPHAAEAVFDGIRFRQSSGSPLLVPVPAGAREREYLIAVPRGPPVEVRNTVDFYRLKKSPSAVEKKTSEPAAEAAATEAVSEQRPSPEPDPVHGPAASDAASADAASPSADEKTASEKAAPPADPIQVRYGPEAPKTLWKKIIFYGAQILSPSNALRFAFSFGRLRAFMRFHTATLNELYIEGDAKNYGVIISPKPEPNMAIYPKKALMLVYLGLLPFVRNRDEWASVVAHEMTHQNEAHLKAATDSKSVTDLLDGLEGYKDLDADQREEIRADLGSLDRMIRAGHNPWAAYEFEKRLTKFMSSNFDLKFMKFLFRLLLPGSFDYYEAHPAGEVRMKAMKAYILQRGFKEDLSEVTSKGFRKFPFLVRLLRWQMTPITFLFTSPWMWRGYLTYAGYKLVLAVLSFFGSPAAEPVRETGGAILRTGGNIFTAIGRFLRDSVGTPILEYVLKPLYEYGLSPIFDALAWLFIHLGDIVFFPVEFYAPGFPRPVSFMSYLAIAVVWFALNTGIKSDGNYPVLLRLKKSAPVIDRLIRLISRGKADDGLVARIFTRARAQLDDLETLFSTQKSAVRAFSRYSGAKRMRARVLAQTESLLGEIADRLEKSPQSALYGLVEKDLDRMPAFVFEVPALRRQLDRIAANRPGTPNSQFSSRMNLLRTADGLKSRFDARVALDAATALVNEGMVESARAVADAHFQRILDFVLSPDRAPEQSVAKDWIALEKQLRLKGTLLAPKWPTRLARDRKLFAARLRRIGSGLAGQMAYLSLAQEVPMMMPALFSPRYWSGRLDHFLFRLRLRNGFGSITALKAFIESEVLSRHAVAENLSIDLHHALMRRPQWASSQAELDALTGTGYFWPKFGGNDPGFLESMLVDVVRKLAKNYPDRWQYEPAASEGLHRIYLNSLASRGATPADLDGRIALFKRLSDRGVTSATDKLFENIYADTPADRLDEIEQLVIDGRIWEQGLKSRVIGRRVRRSYPYKKLLSSKIAWERAANLETVINQVQREYSEKGIHYLQLLEEISREIRSSMEESARIDKAMRVATGERAEDLGLRVLSHMMEVAHGWSKAEQWRLILFLRGDRPPSRRIRQAFKVIGPERIRRMFEVMPVLARTEIIDGFIDSPKGLAGKVDLRKGYSKIILDHVLPKGNPEARRVAYETLESFLTAIKETTGSSGLQTYVLAYMLAMPKNEARSIGRTLKGILEIFGSTGIKIGQFLAASQMLPEEETRILRELQERALEPGRESVYEDIREITGRDDLPFELMDLLGAASIKYAFSARDKASGRTLVLKFFRQSAVAHTRSEFMLLEKMAEHLFKRHGAKYGVFQAIVKAARRAVERELNPENEVARAQVAREKIYAGRGDGAWQVEVPYEEKLFDRLLVSEYAEGGSIWELPAELQAAAARRILELEHGVYFGEEETVRFDPDRHPGNYRIRVERRNGAILLQLTPTPGRISPIDHGQGLEIPNAQRERIFSLFALAQILTRTGPTAWAAGELERILGIDRKTAKRAQKALSRYFPDADKKPVAAYYSILAALDNAGFDMDIAYFDFVRGIVQFAQYEELLPRSEREAAIETRAAYSPPARLEAEVRSRADAMRRTLRLSAWEKAGIAWGGIKNRIHSKLRIDRLLDLKRDAWARGFVRKIVYALLLAAAWPSFSTHALPVLKNGVEAFNQYMESWAQDESKPSFKETAALEKSDLLFYESRFPDFDEFLKETALNAEASLERRYSALELLLERGLAGVSGLDDPYRVIADTALNENRFALRYYALDILLNAPVSQDGSFRPDMPEAWLDALEFVKDRHPEPDSVENIARVLERYRAARAQNPGSR